MKNFTLKIGIGLLFCSQVAVSLAQEAKKETAPLLPAVKLSDNVQVKFGGFVRAEYYYDSREEVGAVDGLFNFFPANKKEDPASGNDLNDVSRRNFSTQATRFNALFTGPDVWKAKSSSFFEFDFTSGTAGAGTTGAGTSTGVTTTIGLRLRHAWVKLNWKEGELLVGKTWNPLADISFPAVIGLNSGIPFRPFGRGDQIRFTWKPTTDVNVLVAALYQSEHKSFMFTDAANKDVLNTVDVRANPIPDLHLQLQYKTPELFAGIVSEFKMIRPATQNTGTSGVFNTTETVASHALGAFADYKENLFNVKGGFLFGQNLSELFQQGGYAVKSYDAATGAKTYSASNSFTSWGNLTYGNKLVVGLFGGYQKNNGFNDNILAKGETGSAFMGRWQDVDHIYRVGPSVKYSIGRLTLAGELEYNVAAYGTIDYANKGKVKDAKEISSVRAMLATTFVF